MWPFTKPEPPDTRPPSVAALAIARSLKEEPARWRIGVKVNYLVHDSLILLDTESPWIMQPWSNDSPDADEAILREAIDAWIEQRLLLPAPEPKPETAAPTKD